MMKKYFSYPLLAICLSAFIAVSCEEEWDDHYYPEIVGKSSMTVFDYIKSRPDMSIFAQMLEKNGYDSILNTAQTFTVWAPLNSSLAGIDLNDSLTVSRIIRNHITQFSIPTANVGSEPLTMLDGKLLPFLKEISGVSLDGKKLEEADWAMSNGIVHVVGDYVPYKLNVWEFLDETIGLDSVRNFINSLTENVYDPEASFNADGVFIDSVFYESNLVLNALCKMKTEDSTYTVVFPDNAAWSDIYGRIFPYYKTLPVSGGVAMQDLYTKWAIVKDLYFSGKIGFGTLKALTTLGDSISNMDEVLNGSQVTTLSNGLAYSTSSLKYKATDVWYKSIKVEAETIVGIDSLKANYTMSASRSLGANMSVSGNRYLTALPASTSSISKLFARFPIPNTLSAKYNIYCVFVPTAIVDTTDLRPCKANFYITYIDGNGKRIKDSKLTVVNNITDPTKITKMLVAENFEFPYSNIPNDETNEKISVILKVENATTTKEEKTYNRTMRIDCIILEPVQ